MGIRIRTVNSYRPDKILRGQMWWVHIRHDSCNPHAQSGMRPVVIISNDKGNTYSPSLLACPLTTQKDKYEFIHPNVMCKGTLSYVQCEQIKVIDKELLLEYIGQVRDVEQDYIDRALAVSIDLSQYIDDSKNLKLTLAERNSELDDAKNRITSLEARISELENENKQYKSNEDMFELGIHVKGIMDILSAKHESPSSQPVSTEIQNNIQSADEHPAQPCEPASKVTYQCKIAKTGVSRNMSAIEKFNARYGQYAKTADSADKCSKPTNAKKWDSDKIQSFVCDYRTMPQNELLTKYSLSLSTAKKYYSKFKNK